MKDVIAEIGHLIHNIRIQPTPGQHLNQQASSSAGNNVPSSARSRSTGTRMV